MTRDVEKLFKALSKKGMTRAFVRVGDKEYIYPLLAGAQPRVSKKRKRLLVIPIGVLILIACVYFYIRWDFTRVTQNKSLKPQTQAAAEQLLTKQSKNSSPIKPLDESAIYAVISGDKRKVKALPARGVEINSRDPYGWTLLHWAAFAGQRDVYNLLLEKGASPGAKTTRKWFTYPAGATPAELIPPPGNKAGKGFKVTGVKK
ncbi:MAG: ankyrin repeat domain-containing protein [bacterium]|nr:ankyrin repeat domain-containing protein [bacterium]